MCLKGWHLVADEMPFFEGVNMQRQVKDVQRKYRAARSELADLRLAVRALLRAVENKDPEAVTAAVIALQELMKVQDR